MKITKVFLFFLALLNFFCIDSAKADEGMWLPLHIERLYNRDLKKMGLQLSPNEIYSVNQACLKDAIVSLGGFCTGEMISDQGLMLTNHHCAYSAIQKHSNVANNYLKDGFWAKNKNQELVNEDLYARFLVRMEDVTKDVLSSGFRKMTEQEREIAIKKVIRDLEDKAIEGTHYEAEVKEFFEGNEFYLFVYETFRDVRLVGAPPSSIGLFGGDSDNWQWPRHTGDFSLFRVYCDQNSKPAEYHRGNIPLKPKHVLPISLKGVEQNDFSFIMGYPGTTDRYLSSPGIKLAIEHTNQYLIDIFKKRQHVLKKEMDKNEAIKIKYASKYAKLGNYYKYLIGQNKGLKRLKVYDKKLEIEQRFDRWVHKKRSRRKLYGDVLKNIQSTYKKLQENEKNYIYSSYTFNLIEALKFSRRFGSLAKELDKNQTAKPKDLEKLKIEAKKYFKDYDKSIDKEVFQEMIHLYLLKVEDEYKIDFFSIMPKEEDSKLNQKKNIDELADYFYEKSIFCNEKKMMAFLSNPEAETLETDPFLILKNKISTLNKSIKPKMEDSYATLEDNNSLFIEGLRNMYPKSLFYPDANSTLRFTYGSVGGYKPNDAVSYDYYTTLKGVMEKEDTTNPEFIVPPRLKKLFEKKDYGAYANENGEMPVAFLTNNDITGGNSGSPVLNGKGELIGVAFDGNWEAMSGDIAFEQALQRTISVDIRYVLFIIDKFANAGHLVREMKLVK